MIPADRPPDPAVRFAPSPNGLLHLGHARSALINWDFAVARGGAFLLRIEDIDTARCRPEFERAIETDLEWLGLSWPKPARRQSEHFDAYREALAELSRLGLVYPAFLSRSGIAAHIRAAEASGAPWPRDPDGAPLYPGSERDMAESERQALIETGAPFAWRLDMARATEGIASPLTWTEAGETGGDGAPEQADPASWGDVVLARRDTPTSYHLSVTVDDHIQGITDVIRGHDLFAATSVHRLLQHLLGLREPTYRHHALVTDPAGRKLSKSDGDTALQSLREAGATPADIRRLAGLAD